jgi:NO-binding membrane sensor protein with MHYT domain
MGHDNFHKTYAKVTELRHYERSEVIASKSGIASLHYLSVAMTNFACVIPVSVKRQKIKTESFKTFVLEDKFLIIIFCFILFLD